MARSYKRQRNTANDEIMTMKRAKVVSQSDKSSSDESVDDKLSVQQGDSFDSMPENRMNERSDTYVAGFLTELERQKQSLEGQFHNHGQVILREDAELQTAFILAASKLLDHQNDGEIHGSHQFRTTRHDGHPLQESARFLLESSKKLVATYERIDPARTQNEGTVLIDKEWDGDCKKLNHLFNLRGKTVKSHIKNLLQAHERSAGDKQQQMTLENEQILWRTFSGAEHQVQENDNGEDYKSWGRAAKRAEHGIRRLVRGLSVDDD